ncbi:unnamed protein product [Meganyctiphanes norvegica]|uniref:Uncharacterized protein n=1 Tax=Meganyctiphanes norvegica TaxID=48144 RepID=A0AAV2SB79_MEGNR
MQTWSTQASSFMFQPSSSMYYINVIYNITYNILCSKHCHHLITVIFLQYYILQFMFQPFTSLYYIAVSYNITNCIFCSNHFIYCSTVQYSTILHCILYFLNIFIIVLQYCIQ